MKHLGKAARVQNDGSSGRVRAASVFRQGLVLAAASHEALSNERCHMSDSLRHQGVCDCNFLCPRPHVLHDVLNICEVST